MTKATRRRLFQIVSLLLAVGLLYLSLRGIDLSAIVEAFREADYRWLPPLAILIVVANLLRAWRWQILVQALPASARTSDDAAPTDALDEAPDGTPPSRDDAVTLEASFSSIMIGYMVNYAAPRMGEVARTANLATRTRLRFSSLFGTVVSERIFDTAVLGAAVLSAFGLLIDRLPVLNERFLVPALERFRDLPLQWILLVTAATLAVVAGGGWWIWRSLQREQSALHQLWTNTLQPALRSFRDGLMTLVTSRRRAAILGSTVGMWVGYLLMAYIPFAMLGLAAPYNIGLVDAWILMAIGALGLLVPSPGGLGSYHYVTIVALVALYGVPEAPAATYAVLTHAAQLVFYVLAGVAALLFQGTNLASLLSSRAPSESVPASDASDDATPSTPAARTPHDVEA